MEERLHEARENLIQGLGRVSSFWGFSKVVGQLYGLLYLSPQPISLDAMADQLSVSKGNISINIRLLERLGMVRKVWQKGERKDYYEAETDFWKVVKGILREREKREFDQALGAVSDSLHTVKEVKAKSRSGTAVQDEAAFLEDRLKRMQDFFTLIDGIVQSAMTLEDLRFDVFARKGR